ncbi:hypothetical protein IPG36_03385 [bacterium]|nr:MAG: hypothetical protein IPG36_03385 [bacterium]
MNYGKSSIAGSKSLIFYYMLSEAGFLALYHLSFYFLPEEAQDDNCRRTSQTKTDSFWPRSFTAVYWAPGYMSASTGFQAMAALLAAAAITLAFEMVRCARQSHQPH